MKPAIFVLPLAIGLATFFAGQTSTHPRKSHSSPATANASSQNFSQSCANPSYPSADATPADSSCGLEGSGGLEANQNAAKNDFCAAGGATTLTFDDFKKLQTQVANTKNINWGDKNTATRHKGPTVDRAPLEKMGEGKLVVVNGFILIARQEGAESVNCGSSVANQPAYHDIHISLVPSATETDECNGIVVEMSPHHRPAEWTPANVNKLAKAHTAVRVTGHLLFDSSHQPCVNGQVAAGNPKRFSLWEVHPIYQLEVCTGDCDGNGQWSALSEWAKQN